MKKKILLLKWLPFIIGIILFCLGIYNIVSSLLFLLGGYFGLKMTFNKRVVNEYIKRKKNDSYDNSKINNKSVNKECYSFNDNRVVNNVVLSNNNKNVKIRKRIK